MVANFLHHFPQYTLRNLCDGTVALHEMLWLYAGMIDATAPEDATASVEDQVAEQTRAIAAQAHERAKKRGGW